MFLNFCPRRSSLSGSVISSSSTALVAGVEKTADVVILLACLSCTSSSRSSSSGSSSSKASGAKGEIIQKAGSSRWVAGLATARETRELRYSFRSVRAVARVFLMGPLPSNFSFRVICLGQTSYIFAFGMTYASFGKFTEALCRGGSIFFVIDQCFFLAFCGSPFLLFGLCESRFLLLFVGAVCTAAAAA